MIKRACVKCPDCEREIPISLKEASILVKQAAKEVSSQVSKTITPRKKRAISKNGTLGGRPSKRMRELLS